MKYRRKYIKEGILIRYMYNKKLFISIGAHYVYKCTLYVRKSIFLQLQEYWSR